MEKITLSFLGLEEELTLNFNATGFRKDLSKLFNKSLKKDIFEFKRNLFYEFPEMNEEEIIKYIHEKIKTAEPNEYISPQKSNQPSKFNTSLTLMKFIKTIFIDALYTGSSGSENILSLILAESEFTLITIIKDVMDIERFRGLESNLEKEENIQKFKKKIAKLNIFVK